MGNNGLAGSQPVKAAGGGAGGGQDLQAAAAGAGVDSISKKPRKKPNTITVTGGWRTMKGYPVTGDELLTLGLVQGGSAISFALSGSAFGFWLSTKQAIDLASGDVALAAARAKWEAYGDAGWYAAAALAAVGIFLFAISGFRAWRIMKGTNHD